MNLGIDDAGQRMQAPGIDPLRRIARELAEGGNAAAANPDIGPRNPVGRGRDCAMDDQVETLAQGKRTPTKALKL